MKEIHISLSNIAHCACSRCPSFPGRVHELIHMDMVTKLFCGHGKAKTGVTQKECICGECPVYSAHELTEGASTKQAYYCIYGMAGENYEGTGAIPEAP
ncbi:MAG: DUF2769 domain-containing protein [Actinobacteria bacterium]|nr:DUF2769 domain-containing protein [Actinomycetota bacterium]